MAKYGVYNEIGFIIRERDGAYIPNDPTNRDYQEAMAAVDAGDVIEPFSPPPLTVEVYRAAIQTYVDDVARARQYDNGISCASYKDSTNATWAAESAAFIAWRDAVWLYAFGELDKVQNGQRPQPTVQDFLAELPEITWPST